MGAKKHMDSWAQGCADGRDGDVIQAVVEKGVDADFDVVEAIKDELPDGVSRPRNTSRKRTCIAVVSTRRA